MILNYVNHLFLLLLQLKNQIAALYSSRQGGTKSFQKDTVSFGWKPIRDQYFRDQQRVQNNQARRVPGLKYSFVVRDNWTRLNVLPAKIMQVKFYTLFKLSSFLAKSLNIGKNLVTLFENWKVVLKFLIINLKALY